MSTNTKKRTIVQRYLWCFAYFAACQLYITACTEDEGSQPIIDRSTISEWQIDTLHDSISGEWIQPWEMLVLDTSHIIIGGYAANAEYSQFEIIFGSVKNIPGPPVYSLCKAATGYYAVCGPLFHYLPSGKVNIYNIYNANIRGQSIYKLGQSDYIIGTLRDGIYRFDGTSFTKDSVAARIRDEANAMFYFMDIEQHSGQLYAVCNYQINDDSSEWAYLLKETSRGRWEYIDSSFIADIYRPDSARFGNSRLFSSSDDVLFSAGPGGVYKFIDEMHWERLLNVEACFGIGGTRSDDIFFGSIDGKLYHYNGLRVKEVQWPEGIVFRQVTNVIVSQDHIYVLTTGVNSNDAYLLRGKRSNSAAYIVRP